jgi:hypothetical protein
MSPPCRLLFLLALLALSLGLAAPPARAQDGRAQARAKLSEGVALFERGDYAGALARFREAHALFPSPRIHFNMAQAHRELARPVEAIEAYRRFLADARDASSEQRADAEHAVAELLRQVAALTVVADGAGASISVDGRAHGSTPRSEPILLAPGPHQVVVEKQGHESHLEKVVADAGGAYEVRAKLVPRAAAVPARAHPAVSTDATREAAEPAGLGRWQKVGIGTAALGGAALVGGAVSGVLAADRSRQLEERCNGGAGCEFDTAARELESSGKRLERWQWFLLGSGAAAVAGGALMYFLAPREPVRVGLAVEPGLTALTVSSTW